MKIAVLMFALFPIFSHATEREAIFLEIARDANQEVMLMTHEQATQHCSDLGAFLPSAREWAQRAKGFGAKGIVSTCSSNDPECTMYIDGSFDHLYYSSSGFRSYAVWGGKNYFWSSLIEYTYRSRAYVFSGRNGSIFSVKRDGLAAVQCMVYR